MIEIELGSRWVCKGHPVRVWGVGVMHPDNGEAVPVVLTDGPIGVRRLVGNEVYHLVENPRENHAVTWIDEENGDRVHVTDEVGEIHVVDRSEMSGYNRATRLILERWERERDLAGRHQPGHSR